MQLYLLIIDELLLLPPNRLRFLQGLQYLLVVQLKVLILHIQSVLLFELFS
jgi:hypothetical protein